MAEGGAKFELSHLLEEPDIHAVYLERWRAEYLTKALWRLTHERVSWERLPLKPHNVSSGAPSDRKPAVGGFSGSGPRFLAFEVPPVAVLGFDGEQRRLWAASYREALGALHRDERHAWDEHMLARRYSAVFAINRRHAMVRRSVSAPEDLARAALKVLTYSDVR